MIYSIFHSTRLRYDAPISENVTEIYMQPRSDTFQHCHFFKVVTQPEARIFSHTEPSSNIVHYFDIPAQHTQLIITTEAIVETYPTAPIPEALTPDAWLALDQLVHEGDYWDYLLPGTQSRPTDLLYAFADQIDVRATHAQRGDDPLSVLRRINTAIYNMFDYVPKSTKVDSPIDDALAARRGVCQDFSHIMIALVRTLGIPCRYVSGYLYHERENGSRSSPDASHAWVEALLPEIGWVGFDPTNNMLTDARHVRVGIGREYADVPPSRGVFKGKAESTLTVAVRVRKLDRLPQAEPLPPNPPSAWMTVETPAEDTRVREQIQAQQQQQQ
ncbi:MAG: transglutaminase family protein [Anaerolineae bacterium]|nr:transglutaminase family protein [Anaerolineae bacterium]